MTLDENTEKLLKELFPDVASRFVLVANYLDSEFKLSIRMTEGLRTFETQEQYYAKGRVKTVSGKWQTINAKEVVTHALPGQSLHQYGLAFDICFLGLAGPYPENPECWKQYGLALRKFGFEWGGDWLGATNDRPHGEDRYGFTLKQLKTLYLKKNSIIDVWDACKLEKERLK